MKLKRLLGVVCLTLSIAIAGATILGAVASAGSDKEPTQISIVDSKGDEVGWIRTNSTLPPDKALSDPTVDPPARDPKSGGYIVVDQDGNRVGVIGGKAFGYVADGAAPEDTSPPTTAKVPE